MCSVFECRMAPDSIVGEVQCSAGTGDGKVRSLLYVRTAVAALCSLFELKVYLVVNKPVKTNGVSNGYSSTDCSTPAITRQRWMMPPPPPGRLGWVGEDVAAEL